MSPSTSRSPATAASRDGRAIAVRTHDAGLDALLAEPGLSSTAKAIAVALARRWAWGLKERCWPSDASIAAAVGKSIGHARRCLRELEAAGLVRRERSAEVATGRVIRLLWRSTGHTHGARTERPPARTELRAPARTRKNVVIVKGGIEPEETGPAERSRPAPVDRPADPPSEAPGQLEGRPQVLDQVPTKGPENRSQTDPKPVPGRPQIFASTPERESTGPAATPVVLGPEETQRLVGLPEATRDRVSRWLASGDRLLVAEAQKLLAPAPTPPERPATVAELLSRLREDPAHVPAAAAALCRAFDDPKSYAGYHAKLAAAWRGEIAIDSVEEAYRQASSGRARNAGALFMHAIKR